MTIRPDKLDAFLDHFDRSAPRIRAFPGCAHLELWQDARFENVVATHSHWHSAEALEHYRRSDLFRTTWAEVKPLFAAAPTAHSYIALRTADEIDAAGETENR